MDINNLAKYNERMRKSLIDKIFFMDKVENVDTIIDFGCADGTLLKFLAIIFPEYNYIGYDHSKEMLSLARDGAGKIKFTSNLKDIITHIDLNRSILLLSSVIHEVYSYSSREEIQQFWAEVFYSGFRYIAIRDMIPNRNIKRQASYMDLSKVYQPQRKEQIDEFEHHWGSLSNNINLVHYLLKYRYTDNWNHEVAENYLPLIFEDLLYLIPDFYEIDFCEHYTLPYVKNIVREDFGIVLKDNTHAKLILQKKQ